MANEEKTQNLLGRMQTNKMVYEYLFRNCKEYLDDYEGSLQEVLESLAKAKNQYFFASKKLKEIGAKNYFKKDELNYLEHLN
jgi:hypothetical protein